MTMNRFRGALLSFALLAVALPALLVGCGGTSTPPVDTYPPSVIIGGTSATTATGPVAFTFTFSEDVGSSFTASDVVVTNATAAATVTKADATHYTLLVTPTPNTQGTIQVSVAAGTFTDLTGNPNAGAVTASQAYDVKPPTVAITGTSGSAVSTPVTLTFTFSEDVGTSFTASDVTITGGGTVAASVTKSDATHYTLVATPPALATGTMHINVAIGTFTDLAGNANAVAATASQAYDTTVVVPTAPTSGAPAPSLLAANVISLYTSSNHYTNITVGNWNPDWGQGGSISDAVVGGATVKLMNLVNYQGINIASQNGDKTDPGAANITGKSTLHVSYWTANGVTFNFSPINNAGEYAIPSGTLTQGAWTDLEFPITQAGFDLTTIRQLKFETTGGAAVIYLDNIYFH